MIFLFYLIAILNNGDGWNEKLKEKCIYVYAKILNWNKLVEIDWESSDAKKLLER